MPPPIAIGTSGDPQNPPAGSASVPQNPAAIPAQISGRQPSTSGTLAGTPAIAIRTEGTTASAASAGSPNSGGPLLRPTSGAAASTDGAALADRAQAARATLATTTPGRVGPTANLAIPQPAGPGDRNSPTIGHGLFGSGSAPAPAAVTGGSPFPLAAPTPGAGGSPQLQGAASLAGLSQPPLGGQPPAIPATATALAASVVAMSQSGQSTTVLRLDPPSLGALSIHIALTGNATVNVVFVPSVPQTAQLIHGALPDLHHAMASAGLNLGEAQVGGGAGGSPNGQAGHQTGERTSFAQTAILSRTASEAEPAPVKDGLRGARAVA
ncbi:flagellar hook-length control protein FliK [Acidisoma sp.]|uniref:flagellar hook-length control protein FliK n=1 Tax=Acidisoma sp. TaxID=1872115 RepID=UPI002D7E21C7|nr:flagellar hook-length control protein FliK [Acidisoma sp.]